ncbi:hypothetical protein BD410DRAFT_835311 [Rickenella mellea]|uniref:ZZ-type domain-containing protein n=1 Tax=Rickenella mellea TaxID=50990 RepID=A0A4Y7QK80_9AGAM|nr:hypothetical protein BD410DRAFT_835311 [Rickenella mellea]
MFYVKATYHGETRKFTFGDSTFPSYIQICNQLYRVFPINGSYYLSKLLFCPLEGSRVLVGMEAHNEAQYNGFIAPFAGRAWPDGLLKFSIYDETPHKLPLLAPPPSIKVDRSGVASLSEERMWLPTPPPTTYAPRYPRTSGDTGYADFFDFSSFFPATGGGSKPHTPGGASSSVVPTFKSTSNEFAEAPMDVDRVMNSHITRANSNAAHTDDSCRKSCCSVSDSKEEIKELVSNFLREFNRSVSSTFGDLPLSAPSTPRAPVGEKLHTIQKDVDTSSSFSIPGSFVEQSAVNDAAPPPSGQLHGVVHHDVWCDFCGDRIRGLRSKCRECANYDLCEMCITYHNAVNVHIANFLEGGRHTFRIIETPSSDAQEAQNVKIVPPVPAPPVIHAGVVCDMCNDTIIGTRNKCLDCMNYDLCSVCLPRAEQSHHEHHQFYAIEEPGRVVVHTVYDDDEIRRESGHGRRDHSRTLPVLPTDGPNPPPAPAEQVSVHQARCDLCDSKIIGVRYKCLGCPDFDTCQSCFQITSEQHPGHVFVTLNSPQDLMRKDMPVRHSARCDSCGKYVFGLRYKCMHPECPDYDLCENCEALPIAVHPNNHPMLKMRNPNTVVPTVYRVGGTNLIDLDLHKPMPKQAPSTSEASVAAVVPTAETAEAAVQLPQPETVEAAVDAAVPNVTPAEIEDREATIPSTHDHIQEMINQLKHIDISPFLPTSADFFDTVTPKEVNNSNMEEKPMMQILQPSALFGKFPVTPKSNPSVPELRALFISDEFIEDGQLFPAGAEFIKSWQMKNDGEVPWPETTEVMFVTGDRMPAFDGAPSRYPVGRVETGQVVSIFAGDMKTPELPGKYVSYWRLTDGLRPFGQSVWCDIVVAEPEEAPSTIPSSLSSSAVVMPESAPSRSLPSVTDGAIQGTIGVNNADDAVSSAVPSLASEGSDDGDSSVSLIDHLDSDSDSDSDDSAIWQESRSRPAPPAVEAVDAGDVEYVVLYEDDSSSAEDA